MEWTVAGTVAENCTRECMGSNLRETKIQNLPGGMPPTPLDVVCLDTQIFTKSHPLPS